MEKNYLTIEKMSSYKKSFDFANEVWDTVIKWDFFAKDTVGKQLVRAVDSISANIAEGFGRYSKKDKVRFYRISLGSLEETGDWVRKAYRRELISSEINANFTIALENIRIETFHSNKLYLMFCIPIIYNIRDMTTFHGPWNFHE
jgi:four helix bundle protein